MIVKLLNLDLIIPGCSSLKEKRFVVSSLKARLRQRFNASVAEVEFQDKWQRCRLAIALVGSEMRTLDTACDRVLEFVERDHRVNIADIQREEF